MVALFARPPTGRPLPARSLVADHAVLTALANDVGYELVFSRQLISTAGPADIALGLSTSGSSVNLLRAFAEARRLGLLTVGLAGYDGGSMAASDTIDHCLVVRSDSVHRIQEAQSAVVFDLWERVQRHLPERSADDRVTIREAAVLERIEAFRRRRPRLTDEIVTLAHGAGGKSSAALIDAVFLEAFATTRSAPLADAARLDLPGGDRLAFSTDSFVVRPRFFPGGSIGHLAVHGTVNDVAMLGARPRWLSAAFVIEEGFADHRAARHRRRHGRGRSTGGRDHRGRRHQGGRPRCGRRAVHHDRRCRRAAGGPHARGRSWCSPATSSSCRARSPTTGWP